nr:MAG TPA: putative DNA double strand break repair [Caudoviricetes sp.]
MKKICKKRLLALVFSDLHLNNWAKFNNNGERTENGFKVLSLIAEKCSILKVPALFCGDLFHKPNTIDTTLLNRFVKWQSESYNKYPSFRCYAISGNHDLPSLNRIDNLTESLIDGFSGYGPSDWGFKLLNKSSVDISFLGNITVHGVPYIDHNIGLCEYLSNIKLDKTCKNILLLHTDYPGATDTDGRRIDSVENLNINTLNRFDLVLCGHIHKHQRLAKKVYMVGAPLQQRRTDKNCEMGYWELYEDLSLKFISLEGFPKFIDVEKEEDIKDDGNYYTIIPPTSKIEQVVKHKITKQLSKKRLVRRYMRTIGSKDKTKEKLLIEILNKVED